MLRAAVAADEAYAPYAAALLHSLLMHNAADWVEFHFLHPVSLSRATLAGLQSVGEFFGGRVVTHAVPDDAVSDLPAEARFTPAIWYRILLPRLLPNVSRVLYLDADTLVMGNLEPLWSDALDGYPLGAVRDVFEPMYAGRIGELGLSSGADYFNSGVLLMDLDALRQQGMFDQVAEIARREGSRFLFPDQDALNAAFAGRWKRLHPRWNCQSSMFHRPESAQVIGSTILAEALQSPGILHFEGLPTTKPWHYLSNHPMQALYLRHLRATPWSSRPLYGHTLMNIVRKRAIRPLRQWLGSSPR